MNSIKRYVRRYRFVRSLSAIQFHNKLACTYVVALLAFCELIAHSEAKTLKTSELLFQFTSMFYCCCSGECVVNECSA